jgi:basic amino acid/polyamine antiporter, APA family
LPTDQRRWPRPIAVVGLAGCLTLTLTLPAAAIATGIAVLALGLAMGRLTRSDTRRARRGA